MLFIEPPFLFVGPNSKETQIKERIHKLFAFMVQTKVSFAPSERQSVSFSSRQLNRAVSSE